MSLLTDEQIDRVVEALFNTWGTCYNCMPYEGGDPVWIVPHCELGEAIQVAFIDSKVADEVDYDPVDHIDELIEELQLSCPNCGTDWDEQWVEVGEELAGPYTEVTLMVPTLNDELQDFDTLFGLWEKVNDDFLDVTFDFSNCDFLRPNAVAFLGGLARLIADRSGRFVFKWNTLKSAIQTNLAQNGFMAAFGHNAGPWTGNSIPYREDRIVNKWEIINYLQNMWLGRDWVHVSKKLRNSIAGTMWEVYTNAFEHSKSPIGIVSCGQHYPYLNELKLTVVDFGLGIPSTVRWFKKKSDIPASKTLKWAFQPGTTTKPNGISRGAGLDLLKNFIKINNGRLEIFSQDGYALIDEHQETYTDRRTFFEGTLINITLKCDESYYHFASEEVDRPLF